MTKPSTVLTTLLSSLYFASLAHAETPAPADSSPGIAVPANTEAAPAPSATPTPSATASAAPATSPSAALEQPSPSAIADAANAKEESVQATPPVRDGFYLRAVSGPGFLSLRGNGPGGTASFLGSSSVGGIAIGGSIARGLVLAGTLSGSGAQATFKGGPFRNATLTVDGRNIDASHKADASFGELGLLIDWYPNPAAGWHAGLSGGVGVITIKNDADDSSFVGVSPAGSIFGGYDWNIGRSWSLGLSLALSGGTAATMKHSSGGGDAGYQLTPVSASLQGSVLYF